MHVRDATTGRWDAGRVSAFQRRLIPSESERIFAPSRTHPLGAVLSRESAAPRPHIVLRQNRVIPETQDSPTADRHSHGLLIDIITDIRRYSSHDTHTLRCAAVILAAEKEVSFELTMAAEGFHLPNISHAPLGNAPIAPLRPFPLSLSCPLPPCPRSSKEWRVVQSISVMTAVLAFGKCCQAASVHVDTTMMFLTTQDSLPSTVRARTPPLPDRFQSASETLKTANFTRRSQAVDSHHTHTCSRAGTCRRGLRDSTRQTRTSGSKSARRCSTGLDSAT